MKKLWILLFVSVFVLPSCSSPRIKSVDDEKDKKISSLPFIDGDECFVVDRNNDERKMPMWVCDWQVWAKDKYGDDYKKRGHWFYGSAGFLSGDITAQRTFSFLSARSEMARFLKEKVRVYARKSSNNSIYNEENFSSVRLPPYELEGQRHDRNGNFYVLLFLSKNAIDKAVKDTLKANLKNNKGHSLNSNLKPVIRDIEGL